MTLDTRQRTLAQGVRTQILVILRVKENAPVKIEPGIPLVCREAVVQQRTKGEAVRSEVRRNVGIVLAEGHPEEEVQTAVVPRRPVLDFFAVERRRTKQIHFKRDRRIPRSRKLAGDQVRLGVKAEQVNERDHESEAAGAAAD